MMSFLFNIGVIKVNQGDLSRAETSLRQSKRLAERIKEESRDQASRSRVEEVLKNLRDAFTKLNIQP